MKIAPLADVKARLSEYLRACVESPVIVTRNGRPAGILVAAPESEEDLDRFVLAHTPRFRRILEAGMDQIRRKGGLKHADFWKKVRGTG